MADRPTAEDVFTEQARLILMNEQETHEDLTAIAQMAVPDRAMLEYIKGPDDYEAFSNQAAAAEIREYILQMIGDDPFDYSHNPMLSAMVSTAVAYIDEDELARMYRQSAREDGRPLAHRCWNCQDPTLLPEFCDDCREYYDGDTLDEIRDLFIPYGGEYRPV